MGERRCVYRVLVEKDFTWKPKHKQQGNIKISKRNIFFWGGGGWFGLVWSERGKGGGGLGMAE